MSRAHSASQLFVAVWVGALLCFMALVTPALFQAYAPDEAAKAVRIILPRLDLVSAGLLIAAIATGLRLSRLRTGLLAVALLLALVSALYLTPTLAALRRQADDKLSQRSREDPLRKQFGRLHGVSSSAMVLELLLGLSALTLGRRAPSVAGG